MKIPHKMNFTDLIEHFIDNLRLIPKRMRYAFPSSFSALNFESTTEQTVDEYLTVAQMSQRYPAFTQGSIRWLIFNANTNGFNKVVRKIGRKVVLNLCEFKRWIEKQTA